jgi:SSS family transporter
MVYAIIGLYAAFLVLTGVFIRRKVTGLNDFYLGGRNVGPWMSAFAYGTSYFSAVIFIGYAGSIGWRFGLAATFVGIGNALIGSYIAWKLCAKRTRSMTQRLGAATMPTFFEKRYNSKALKIAAAAIAFLFLTPYSASVFQGISYLFEQTLGISYNYCMIGMAVIAGIYLIFGGYLATSITDFIQGIVMLAGIVLVVVFVVSSQQVGGLAAGVSKLEAIDPSLVSLQGAQGIVPLLSLILLTSLGAWALPQMVHKFYAIKDERAIKRGTVISTVFALIVAGSAYFIGSWGRLFLNNQMPVNAATGAANADLIMPTMLQQVLPNVLMGIVLVMVLAASMTTLTSLVMATSSSVSIDIVKGALAPKMEEKKVMLIMRICCAIFLLISLIIAVGKFSAILTLMSFSWGTVSGSFIGPYIYGLRWKGTTKAGAWAGFITGFLVSIIGAIATGFQSASAPMIGAGAMLASLAVTPLVSLVTPKLPEEHIKTIFLEKV